MKDYAVISVFRAGKGDALRDTIAIPMGDVPWEETSQAIRNVISRTESDVQCFVAMIRIATIMFKAGSAEASEEKLMGIVSAAWQSVEEIRPQGQSS